MTDTTKRNELARAIWETSHADEGTISATGANIIADALLTAGYSKPDPIQRAIAAALNLHDKEPMQEGQIIGPYCTHCISPIDGGPELYPCMTVRAVLDALKGTT